MDKEDWRQRLSAAIESSGKSKRSISQTSGNGPGYLHSILSEGKDPTITKLLAVCDAIPVSALLILFGHDVTPADAHILDLLHQNPSKRDAIQQLISDGQ